MKKLILILCLTAASVFGADVIPAARRYPWEAGVTVGVPGGIPTNRTQFADVTAAPYNADNTGVADATAAVQAALDAATSGTFVYMPAGTYRFNSGVGIKSNVTLRGAGMGVTTIMYYGASGGAVGMATVTDPGAFSWPHSPIPVTALKGDTSIRYSDTALDAYIGARVGRMMKIDLKNNLALPVVSVAGYERMQLQMVKVESFTTTPTRQITFSPPLAFDLSLSLEPQFSWAQTLGPGGPVPQTEFAGVESLTVDATNSTSPHSIIGMNATFACWVYACEVKNVTNYMLGLFNALYAEVRFCNLHKRKTYPIGGSNGAGLLTGAAWNCLIEDNIIDEIFAGVQTDGGSGGNVFAYNYMNESVDFGVIGTSFDSNHGPHNSWQHFEGNIIARYQSDGLFGGESNATLFRNWLHGTSLTATTYRWPLNLNRFSYNFNIVGNILGRTDQGIAWEYSNMAVGFNTTSTTSIGIGTGSKAFTVDAGLLASAAGTVYLIYSASSPANWMTGRVASYSGTTLDMTINRAVGSGTFTDWVIRGGSGTGFGQPLIYSLGLPNLGNGGFFGDYTAAAPSLGYWWRVWDGTRMVRPAGFDPDYNQPNTPYNSMSAYTTYEVVEHTAAGQNQYTGGEGIIQWIANNPAKNGLATWDTPGPASADWLPISGNSFQELDYDTYLLAIIRGNWNAATESIQATEAMGADTYPNSYFRTTKPAFFGSIAWPPIDPTNVPADQSTNLIAFGDIQPAAWRFLKGNTNYLTATNTLTVTGTTTVGGTLTLPP